MQLTTDKGSKDPFKSRWGKVLPGHDVIFTFYLFYHLSSHKRELQVFQFADNSNKKLNFLLKSTSFGFLIQFGVTICSNEIDFFRF